MNNCLKNDKQTKISEKQMRRELRTELINKKTTKNNYNII